ALSRAYAPAGSPRASQISVAPYHQPGVAREIHTTRNNRSLDCPGPSTADISNPCVHGRPQPLRGPRTLQQIVIVSPGLTETVQRQVVLGGETDLQSPDPERSSPGDRKCAGRESPWERPLWPCERSVQGQCRCAWAAGTSRDSLQDTAVMI